MCKHQTGFTLIELMSAVTIIGILASTAIPAYMNYITKTKMTEGMMLATHLITDIADYYAYTGKLPENNEALAIPSTEHLSGKYVKDITVEHGAIHISFNERAGDDLENKILTLQPAILESDPPNNIITWVCGYANPLNGMILKGKNRTNISSYLLPSHCL